MHDGVVRQVLVAYEADSGRDSSTWFDDTNRVVGVNQLLLVVPIEGIRVDDLAGIAYDMDAVIGLHIVGSIIDRCAFRCQDAGMESEIVIELDLDARIEKRVVLLIVGTNPPGKQNCAKLAIVREADRCVVAHLRRNILPRTWVNARLDFGLLTATNTQLNCKEEYAAENDLGTLHDIPDLTMSCK